MSPTAPTAQVELAAEEFDYLLRFTSWSYTEESEVLLGKLQRARDRLASTDDGDT